MLRDMFGDLSPVGRFWMWLGLVTLVAAAAMSFLFGWQVSAMHALFLACLSVITAFGPEAAYRMFDTGKRRVGFAIAAICVPLFAIELYSHAGYTAGLRGLNVSEARVQNTRYDHAQAAAKDDSANVSMWREQKAKLEAEREALITAKPWAATVTAAGLRAELPAIDEAIRQEAGRVRCAGKCLALQQKKAEIEARIGSIEALDGVRASIADLDKRLEATQRILDGKRVAAAKVEHKSSAVSHQNAFLSRAAAMVHDGSLTPSEMVEEVAQQSVAMSMAVAGTFLPAFALFVAGLFRISGGRQHNVARLNFRDVLGQRLAAA